MLNPEGIFNVYVKKQIGDELWIDFLTKKEKWNFIQKHLPDMASFILAANSKKDYKLATLLVKKDWLESLSDVVINY